MTKIDNKLLDDMGYKNLSESDKALKLKEISSLLQDAIGDRIQDTLSEEQLKQFQKVIDDGDEQKAISWLKLNLPDYKNIADQELNVIIDQIKTLAENMDSK